MSDEFFSELRYVPHPGEYIKDAIEELGISQNEFAIRIGTTGKTFNGSANVSWTLAEIGAAAASHTHSYAGSSSAGGAANSVKTNLIIKLNGGSTEGTNLFTFNGSTAKTINITDMMPNENYRPVHTLTITLVLQAPEELQHLPLNYLHRQQALPTGLLTLLVVYLQLLPIEWLVQM